MERRGDRGDWGGSRDKITMRLATLEEAAYEKQWKAKKAATCAVQRAYSMGGWKLPHTIQEIATDDKWRWCGLHKLKAAQAEAAGLWGRGTIPPDWPEAFEPGRSFGVGGGGLGGRCSELVLSLFSCLLRETTLVRSCSSDGRRTNRRSTYLALM